MGCDSIMGSNRDYLKDWEQDKKVKRIPICLSSLNQIIPSQNSIENIGEKGPINWEC